ncbi:alpha/beta hydrolase [Arachidicoccus terrestris]|uniref:alpha/beta hydrolase n=1 Tax=Arachidicoccus terrestris TaxID=2875539 RepID=UPI001CC634DD|nr:dienelactone hydrolase family protein [Arachidicoccus terrestris]UAY57050.1 dienelactone hydrolase family protein [Arachidicoccus terrestris]
MTNNTHTLDIHRSGTALEKAEKALIMLHGRGGSADDILSLAPHLNVRDYALIAPQATGNTWYPLSFMAPAAHNEPWLSSAIEMVRQTVEKITQAGISPENIYFFGFSQGACLTLEFLARYAMRYGGAVAVIGGLIGEQINSVNYKGDFKQTPVFIGTSNPDFHVPIARVYATENILQDMNADVHLKEYPGFGHSINRDEIDQANKIVFNTDAR